MTSKHLGVKGTRVGKGGAGYGASREGCFVGRKMTREGGMGSHVGHLRLLRGVGYKDFFETSDCVE